MKIIVASKNPVKMNAALKGFQRMFPDRGWEVEGVSVPSGVSDQPQGDSEIYTGALNRADNASQEMPNGDYYIGIEGGVEEKDSVMSVFAWIVVKSADGKYGSARTATFFLPEKVAELIRGGKELGEADDIVFGRSNSKQVNGSVGILTGDVVDRTSYYTEAVILALIPFKNKELY